MEKRERLTEAEAKAWEDELKAAGITVVTDAPSTVTLLRKQERSDDRRSDGSGVVE